MKTFTTWVPFTWQGIPLNAKIRVPEFVHETREQPKEGGFEELELLALECKGNDVKKMFENSNIMDDILECLKDEFNKMNLV